MIQTNPLLKQGHLEACPGPCPGTFPMIWAAPWDLLSQVLPSPKQLQLTGSAPSQTWRSASSAPWKPWLLSRLFPACYSTAAVKCITHRCLYLGSSTAFRWHLNQKGQWKLNALVWARDLCSVQFSSNNLASSQLWEPIAGILTPKGSYLSCCFQQEVPI